MLADGGAIVNTGSSSTAAYGVTPGYATYAAMKGGLNVLTGHMGKEFSARGIRVNAVAPGPTRTRLGGDAFDRNPEAIPPLAARTALGKIGDPDDVAAMIAVLAGDEDRWVTAQILEVSGGFNR
ncbi:SDR family oxidoreductase [Nonomuraea fastidiosa]|uniref:SDR family oxidoreductase n=1 Tax=Nonomuraea fastidiosa TaxID=46173 RepID=UPI00366B8E5F